MKQSGLITIAEFAKMCRTTVRTIRFYDNLGLIKPVKVDQFTKYRYYSPYQTRDFFRIKLVQNFDIPLENVSKILKQKDKSKFLTEKITGIQEEISQKQKELKFLKNMKVLFFEVNSLKQITKLETIGPFSLFGTYNPNEAYHTITPRMQEVTKMADKLKIGHYDQQVIFYLDPEKYKPKGTKIEVSVVCKGKIPERLKLPENYFFKKLPRTRAYVTTYKGPFDFITLIYEKLHQLQITQKFPIKFAPIDIQLNGLNPNVSSFDRITKICFPLK